MGGPNNFQDPRPRDLLLAGYELAPAHQRVVHIVGQLALPGYENVWQSQSNEDVINSAVDDGSIERSSADHEIDALAALAIRARATPVE